ncbi:1477_t:CDS:2 [Dentiscutata heterogama]|uniref:1477_t:CDS:1 n=1 Tax=Dentiscutata heterogama TaxID=1316150 RepID=A0ACA9LDV3_9GLOM|nr:1477_t:CDS:2 [Dentiscutata heterogama]
MNLIDESYVPQNRVDLFDSFIIILFPILLIKLLNVEKRERKLFKIGTFQNKFKYFKESLIKDSPNKDKSDEKSSIEDKQIQEIKESIEDFNHYLLDEQTKLKYKFYYTFMLELEHINNQNDNMTLKEILLPFFDEFIFNIVTWGIPLFISFVYDDLLAIKIFSIINMSLYVICFCFAIFAKFFARRFKSKFFGYNINMNEEFFWEVGNHYMDIHQENQEKGTRYYDVITLFLLVIGPKFS